MWDISHRVLGGENICSGFSEVQIPNPMLLNVFGILLSSLMPKKEKERVSQGGKERHREGVAINRNQR